MIDSAFHTVELAPLRVAVPRLAGYHSQSGIGRVLHSLAQHWGERVCLHDAAFVAPQVPLLRNFPRGLRVCEGSDLVLLPQLSGAQALRNTNNVPAISIVHDVGIVDFPGDRATMNWLSRWSVRQSFWGLRHAQQVVTVSRFTRDRLLHYLPELSDRVSVVPNGVAPDLFNPRRSQTAARVRLAEQTGWQPGYPVLLNVGTETPRKNMPLLLEVLRQLKADYPNAQLIKVGQAGLPRWRKQTQRSAAALGLCVGRDILFLDQVDDDLLADAYCSADLFVSTSCYEGFGLPALEAMACGTPVVVAACAALPEIVGSAGWIAAPDAGAFGRVLRVALADPQRHERVSQGRAWAARFTWAQAAERYLEIMLRSCTLLVPQHRGRYAA